MWASKKQDVRMPRSDRALSHLHLSVSLGRGAVTQRMMGLLQNTSGTLPACDQAGGSEAPESEVKNGLGGVTALAGVISGRPKRRATIMFALLVYVPKTTRA